MTSVKDFRVEEEPTATDLGRGRFVFSDRYSVFDWGEMPDHIPNKGASLCLMGAYNFELLEANGVPTHYRGVVSDGEVVALGDVDEPPTEMAIDLTQVPDLPHDGRDYDYEAYHEAAGDNFLVPLEIVFRNSVPRGSRSGYSGAGRRKSQGEPAQPSGGQQALGYADAEQQDQ